MKRYRRSARLTKRQEKPTDYLAEILSPLKRRQIVKMVVSFTKTHGKSKREVKLLVMLAPGEVYGMLTGSLVVSVIGKGSCVLFPKEEKGMAALTGTGLPTSAAKFLLETLHKLYGVDEHAG